MSAFPHWARYWAPGLPPAGPAGCWSSSNIRSRSSIPSAWTPATWRFNASLRYDIGSHQRIALSVTNLLDKMPPRDATWSNYPYYDTSWFDSRGRSFFLQYTHKFGGEAL